MDDGSRAEGEGACVVLVELVGAAERDLNGKDWGGVVSTGRQANGMGALGMLTFGSGHGEEQSGLTPGQAEDTGCLGRPEMRWNQVLERVVWAGLSSRRALAGLNGGSVCMVRWKGGRLSTGGLGRPAVGREE